MKCIELVRTASERKDFIAASRIVKAWSSLNRNGAVWYAVRCCVVLCCAVWCGMIFS